MSVWLYEIHRGELLPGIYFDDQIQKVLRDYGARGWELVQVLGGSTTEDRTYRLIFKTEKPLVGWKNTGTEEA